MSQIRHSFYKTLYLGAAQNRWRYDINIIRVENPNDVPAAQQPAQVTIPSDVFIELGALKMGFDIGALTGADKVGNLSVTMLDDASGAWLRENIFTNFAPTVDGQGNVTTYVYQLDVWTDKGGGDANLGRIFFGEIDLRSLVFEPEYAGAGGRRQTVSFTAVDILAAALQSTPWGDNAPYAVDGGFVPAQQRMGTIAQNIYLPPTQQIPAAGVMNALAYHTLGFDSSRVHKPNIFGDKPLPATQWSPMYNQDTYFATYADVFAKVAAFVANRMGGVANAGANLTAAFSHLALSYGGTFDAAGTAVNDLAAQLAVHRTAFLSNNACEGGAIFKYRDYSLAKQGAAWEALKLLLECFVQYACVSYSGIDTMNIVVRSPLGATPPAFCVDGNGDPIEPKAAKLKYTPYGFSARSVCAKIVNPNSVDAAGSATGSGYANTQIGNVTVIPTNNLSYFAQLTNSNTDVAVELCMGNYWWLGLENQLCVFDNSLTYADVWCVDSNANGSMQSGGALLAPVTINLGFGGALGAYHGLSLTDAVARAVFSMYGGFIAGTDAAGARIESGGMEIAEFEILTDSAAPAANGATCDTATNIEQALLRSVALTTDAPHTFLITGVEWDFFGVTRSARITAVRQL